MTARGVVVMMVVMVVTVVVMLAGVVSGDDHTRHNYATTRRRSSSDWSLPLRNSARGSFLQRLWPDPSQRNHQSLPSPYQLSPRHSLHTPIRPHLQHNDFITEGEDDYDDLSSSSLWQPQTNSFTQQSPVSPASLDSLQHLLEGEVLPEHSPSSLDQIDLGDLVAGDETAASNTFGDQDSEHRDLYVNDNELFPSYETQMQSNSQLQLPLAHQKNYNNPDQTNVENVNEEVIRDLLNQLSINNDLSSNNRQVTGDFLGQSIPFEEDSGNDGDERDTLLVNNFLAPGQYPSPLSEQEPFMKNLLDENQLPTGLETQDIFSNVDNPLDYPDQPSVSDILSGQSSFPSFPQNSFQDPSDDSHFQEYPLENTMDESRGVVGGSAGPDWFPSPSFHLPSSKDLITAYTNPELTQEGQREACHSRSLHTCGGRVIDEFSQQSSRYLEPCRIREDFLDCMEKQRDQPCEVMLGRSFSREETSLIRDKIQSLLWSARGCILGHSA